MADLLNTLLVAGDQSGRPDTSLVDRDQADSYATRMFWAVVNVNFPLCGELHLELNQTPELYVVALDLFREMCRTRGVSSGRWREYSHDS